MNRLLYVLLLLPIWVTAQNIAIIPEPASLKKGNGHFTLNSKTVIVVNDAGEQNTASFLAGYLKRYYNLELEQVKEASTNYIRFATRRFIQPGTEGRYQLNINQNAIEVEGDDYAGTFHGMQSIIQLLPVDVKKGSQSFQLPSCQITDQPRFKYRGLHLDVGRHYMPLDFIKKYIDYIALHKMNYFHWHLTEDQGWRIEIKKYPELTRTGAWRNGTIIGRYPGKGNDNIYYGGYYTQDEIREIVKYAADRFITVMPEIELPGHSSAAIAAFPWLSCFPEKPTHIPEKMISDRSKQELAAGRIKLVQETWGVFDDVYCAGKESTFEFIENVMDEVLELFPSHYIHVGGDESPKAHWKKCPNCQRRIKDLKLKDEHELQSYFIQRVEKYLNKKGRTLVGWDEILEGGLAPNAIVMSWRGETGGIAAARQQHEVIMTPGSHVYLDHQQSEQEDSVTIGGFTPLDKIYKYEPIPAVLNAEQGKYVLGAQGNVWTEYMKSPRKVEYQIFPRLSALAEVLWSPKEKRNWEQFERKLSTQFSRYELWNTNASQAYYELTATLGYAKASGSMAWILKSRMKNARITYQLPGQEKEIVYTAPVVIKRSGNYTARLYHGKELLHTRIHEVSFNKATGKKITLKQNPERNYPGDGPFTLVNGVQNTAGRTKAREFLGFLGKPMDATISFGSSQVIDTIIVHTFHQPPSWIYQPVRMDVYASMDGKNFRKLGSSTEFIPTGTGNGIMRLTVKTTRASYLRVVLQPTPLIPEGNPGAGTPAWLFVDEIEVN